MIDNTAVSSKVIDFFNTEIYCWQGWCVVQYFGQPNRRVTIYRSLVYSRSRQNFRHQNSCWNRIRLFWIKGVAYDVDASFIRSSKLLESDVVVL